MYKILFLIVTIQASQLIASENNTQTSASITGVQIRSTEIVTDYERKTAYIFPVTIYNIDGKEVLPTIGTYHLVPGKRRLRFRARVDISMLPGVIFLSQSSRPLKIDYNFKKNIRYYIGVKAKTKRRSSWKIIIWKQEPVIKTHQAK